MVTSLVDMTNILSAKSCLKCFLIPWVRPVDCVCTAALPGLNLFPQEHFWGLPPPVCLG